jgi:hypothetical protein
MSLRGCHKTSRLLIKVTLQSQAKQQNLKEHKHNYTIVGEAIRKRWSMLSANVFWESFLLW